MKNVSYKSTPSLDLFVHPQRLKKKKEYLLFVCCNTTVSLNECSHQNHVIKFTNVK